MEFNTILNNLYLCKNTNKSKLFLHSSEFLNIIHFVEYHENICTRRIEFKKKVNDDNKYLYFSLFITDNIAFSGDLKISSNCIIGSFEITKLEHKTHIIEGFYINFNSNAYTLEHLETSNISKKIIDKEPIMLNLSNINNFLQIILSKINNYCLYQNQEPYCLSINFSKILEFEQKILLDLENIENPDISNFIKNYETNNNLKRTKAKE